MICIKTYFLRSQSMISGFLCRLMKMCFNKQGEENQIEQELRMRDSGQEWEGGEYDRDCAPEPYPGNESFSSQAGPAEGKRDKYSQRAGYED